VPVLIKRYANRKLYNTATSRYITLKGISDLIEAGEEVQVRDNEMGEDITSVTLSQILVDTERSNRSVPGNLLSELLSRGGDVFHALRRGMGDASEGIEEIQTNIRRMLRGNDRMSDWVAFAPGDFDRLVQRAMERVFKLLDLPRRSDIEALRESLDRVARALEGPSPSPPEPPATPERHDQPE
jgi:polyhydroxyalkanoate synthesis repressor PhaR